MVYNENAIFKRDKVTRNGKLTNQIRVTGLSVNSEFEDGEEIVVLRKTDFTEMVSNLETLGTQLGEANTEIENLKNATPEVTPETPKYSNKVIELQELINNRNGLLMETQNTINNIILEVTNQYNQLSTEVTSSNTQTKENISTLVTELQTITSNVIAYCKEMENQVNGINSSIDNTSWFKWIRSKNKFKIVIDWDKLRAYERQLTEFNNTNSISKANEVFTPIELPTNKLEELTTEDLDLRGLYISLENEGTTEDIPSKVVTPEADNGNHS